MKSKIVIFIILSAAFVTISVIISCASSQYSPEQKSAAAPQGAARKTGEPSKNYKGDGGKGIVIAVPAPVLRGAGSADSWWPQFFQDRITGDLARFSAMTVLDRSNESLAIAEQKLSETGFYSDNDMVELGNMTNARYIVAGNIQNTGGIYSVSFRINDIETNVIQASFSGRYGKTDMESGKAAKEAVKELLAGMGIELTEEGEKALLAIQPVDVRATAQLARGVTAEKNGNIVEALGFLIEAGNSNTTRTEANRNIQSFFVDIPTGGIKERVDYGQMQIDKWNKIFSDLDLYMLVNLPVFIYDFSIQEDTISIKEVSFKITPGIKVIPNATALYVYKRIVDEWVKIGGNAENGYWINHVRMPKLFDSVQGLYALSYSFSWEIGLYDSYGDRIAKHLWYGRPPSIYIPYYESDSARYKKISDLQILAQHKYYDDVKFCPILFNSVPLTKITDVITPKIDRVFYSIKLYEWKGIREIDFQVMTVPEYREWLSLQGTAR